MPFSFIYSYFFPDKSTQYKNEHNQNYKKVLEELIETYTTKQLIFQTLKNTYMNSYTNSDLNFLKSQNKYNLEKKYYKRSKPIKIKKSKLNQQNYPVKKIYNIQQPK